MHEAWMRVNKSHHHNSSAIIHHLIAMAMGSKRSNRSFYFHSLLRNLFFLHFYIYGVCAIVVVIVVVVVFIINSVHARAETSVYAIIVIINFEDNVLHYVCLADWAVYIILNFTFAPMLSMLVLHV